MHQPSSPRRDELATIPISLRFDQGDVSHVKEAAQAIAVEMELTRKWIRLQALSVKLSQEDGVHRLYVVSVGQNAKFDWTLEGTTAVRPSLWHLREPDALVIEAACDSMLDSETRESALDEPTSHGLRDENPDEDTTCWRGEIVSVDSDRGLLYINVPAHARAPVTGVFWAQPVNFLRALNELYSGDANVVTSQFLPGRIAASTGGFHPVVTSSQLSPGDQNSGMKELWSHGWSVLWGPPGTGKTTTIANEVARSALDQDRRVLVVSTTNKATDDVAIRIGLKAREDYAISLSDESLVRLGKAAELNRFEQESVESMLGEETLSARSEWARLQREIAMAKNARHRARLKAAFRKEYQKIDDSFDIRFFDPDIRVVVCTAYAAVGMLSHPRCLPELDRGRAFFDTVIIDEAGLIPRVTAAALSMLAADRVWLAGDPRQLSPISLCEGVISPSKSRWLARSSIDHLTSDDAQTDGVRLLETQYRMHPQIGSVVSDFQYEGALKNADGLDTRPWKSADGQVPALLEGMPRAIWYVLDEETSVRPRIRADRGPGNQSWQRGIAIDVLEKLFADAGGLGLSACDGLYVTPFRAQLSLVSRFFNEQSVSNWSASTVHSQQGGEADVVVFDTVRASRGGRGWSGEEWQRLVNVGISRARQCLIVIASRSEMNEAYLRPLLHRLWPGVLKPRGGRLVWKECQSNEGASKTYARLPPETLGGQLAVRESMRPLLSREQERLVGLDLDGKPRLVRGVAGSGKTVVLGRWLVKTIRKLEQLDSSGTQRVWAVYANRSLEGLLTDAVTDAWKHSEIQLAAKDAFPWQPVRFRHLRDVLDELLLSQKMYLSEFENDINAAAAAYLKRVPHPEPLCWAMFVDESQDFGPDTLTLLTRLTEQTDDEDQNSRNVNFFYDNAQNVYGRALPKWKEIGVDLRGRSTVMEESFRSTQAVTELAINVLYRLNDPRDDEEHHELERRELIQLSELPAGDWWRVRFNQVPGDPPTLLIHDHFAHEKRDLVSRIAHWVNEERVTPRKICVLFNGQKAQEALRLEIIPKLADQGIDMEIQTREQLKRTEGSVLATTAHSFKGHDAELVVIFGVNGFALRDQILHHPLYVAMTRARSLLHISGHYAASIMDRKLLEVLKDSVELMHQSILQPLPLTRGELREVLLQRMGAQHADWLDGIIDSYRKQIDLSPVNVRGLDEPVACHFHLNIGLFHWVCVDANEISEMERQRIEQSNLSLLHPGEQLLLQPL